MPNKSKYWDLTFINLKIPGISSVADPDPNPDPSYPFFLGLLDPDPDPLVRSMDPNPDPSDPYVCGPPGSGSFCHQAKIVRTTLIPTAL